jgi:hypothetical protein
LKLLELQSINLSSYCRYLSHKFHGKGPGKNKVEKRMKKIEQEMVIYLIQHLIISNFLFTAHETNEFYRYTTWNCKHAAAKAEGNTLSLRCFEWKQAVYFVRISVNLYFLHY